MEIELISNIRALRHLRNMTLKQLSVASNVHYSTISNYERGKRVPRLDDAVKISIALQIKLNRLYIVKVTKY